MTTNGSAANVSSASTRAAFGSVADHLRDVHEALTDLGRHTDLLERWGAELATRLGGGGRLLAAGNGGSAAEAQHLTAELVGRFECERAPLSAISLHAETSSLTAIANDYGVAEMFARQVQAHGRPGDVLVLLSTSGRSPNLLSAAERGRTHGLRVWGLTGRGPTPLGERCDEVLAVGCGSSTAVQEAHLVAVHALCAAVERHLAAAPVVAAPGVAAPVVPTSVANVEAVEAVEAAVQR